MALTESDPLNTVRVLIVDDHRDGADSLGLLIAELGHEVKVTYGGRQALDVATAFHADLFLVDLRMPDVDGCSLVKRLRTSQPFVHAKIIAITGYADEVHRALASNAGFDSVLIKPITLAGIKAALDSVVAPRSDNIPSRPRLPEKFEAGRRLQFGSA